MPKTNIVVEDGPKIKYRYFCDGCTGRAFYANAPVSFGSKVCLNCGITVQYKPQNWMEVTDKEELEKINR